MKPDSPFLHLLLLVQQKLDRLRNQAERVGLFGSTNDEAAYEAALQLEEQAEKTLLLIRQLPVYTGKPTAQYDSQQVILDSVPVEIGFTPEGWFRLVIPALLPKKNKGNVNYYRGFLYPAMQRFFQEHAPVRYNPCVLIYRHVYAADRPERRMRDHDNIEVNAVSDIVTFYTMPDDHPLTCSHFYCSEKGESDRTEVYVVPMRDFSTWFSKATDI